eukprot:1911787-Alexandrium_andersonii.AAC.1
MGPEAAPTHPVSIPPCLGQAASLNTGGCPGPARGRHPWDPRGRLRARAQEGFRWWTPAPRRGG